MLTENRLQLFKSSAKLTDKSSIRTGNKRRADWKVNIEINQTYRSPFISNVNNEIKCQQFFVEHAGI